MNLILFILLCILILIVMVSKISCWLSITILIFEFFYYLRDFSILHIILFQRQSYIWSIAFIWLFIRNIKSKIKIDHILFVLMLFIILITNLLRKFLSLLILKNIPLPLKRKRGWNFLCWSSFLQCSDFILVSDLYAISFSSFDLLVNNEFPTSWNLEFYIIDFILILKRWVHSNYPMNQLI